MRVKVLAFILAVLLCFPCGVQARPRGIVVQQSAPTGGALVGASSNDLFGGVLNAIDSGNQYSFSGGADPSEIDANGYPNTTLTTGQLIAFGVGFISNQTGSGTSWVFKWTPAGSGTAVFFLNAGWSNISASGCTATGTSTTTITMTGGVACRITFTWTSPPGSNVQVQFKAGTYAAGNPKMVLCRASDEAAVDAGGLWTPEYLASWTGLNLHTIRTMSWINSGTLANTNQSLWKYRSIPSSLGWLNVRFAPGAWAGTSSGTNQYTVSLPSDSGSSGWVDGEVIQANISNASTTTAISVSGAADNGSGIVRLTVSSSAALSTNQQVYVSNISGTWEADGVQTITVIDGTHIDLQGVSFVHAYASSTGGLSTLTLTVSGKTGGTVFIATEAGSAPGAAFTSATISSGNGTFVYDALLGVVKWRSGGILANVPIEAQVALANALNVDLWTVIPTYTDSSYSYATSEAALIGASLNSQLRWHVEYSNEVWNPGFPQTAYAAEEGLILGGISTHGVYSLRFRQMSAAVTAAWPRSQSTLVRVLAWQGFADSTTTTNRLNSAELNASTNSRLLAYAGSVNYTTQGQRAVDFADAGAYATYFSGALLTHGFATAYQTDASAVAQIQTLATAFNSNSSDPTSLATLDNDFRQGTILNNTISSVSGTTINATANGLSNGKIGVFTVASGGAIYSGVALNTPYYVVSAATNSFSVASTFGGSAISLSGGSGTISFGILAGQTMLDLASSIYQNTKGSTSPHPGWEAVATTYDSYRTGVGQALLYIDNYEGALEAIAPTTAQCTTMGVTVGGSAATASAALAAGLAAYKNSSAAATLALAQFNQMMGRDASQPLTYGLMAHSRTPSWFLMVGTSQWSLLSGIVGSSAYQTYNGVAAFH